MKNWTPTTLLREYKTATLVYQAGIANVFATKPGTRLRLIQTDFRSCTAYCQGLIHAGIVVNTAWCNIAGDITNQSWNFDNFDNAPFHDKFIVFKNT